MVIRAQIWWQPNETQPTSECIRIVPGWVLEISLAVHATNACRRQTSCRISTEFDLHDKHLSIDAVSSSRVGWSNGIAHAHDVSSVIPCISEFITCLMQLDTFMHMHDACTNAAVRPNTNSLFTCREYLTVWSDATLMGNTKSEGEREMKIKDDCLFGCLINLKLKMWRAFN